MLALTAREHHDRASYSRAEGFVYIAHRLDCGYELAAGMNRSETSKDGGVSEVVKRTGNAFTPEGGVGVRAVVQLDGSVWGNTVGAGSGGHGWCRELSWVSRGKR